MRFTLLSVSLAAACCLLVSGCNESPEPAKAPASSSASAKPATTQTAGAGAASTAAKPPAVKPATPAPTGPVAVVGPRIFRGGHFEPPHVENGMLLLRHFGVTSATIALNRDAKTVRFKAKPRLTPGNALPIVGLVVERLPQPGSSIYVPFANVRVAKEMEFTTTTLIPKGDYRVTFKYLEHSKMDDKQAMRPHVEFYGVTFE